MFSALLLGLAVDDLIAVGFFVFIVAGTAATLFTNTRPIAEEKPDSDEVDERLVTAADMLVVQAAFDDHRGRASSLAKVSPGSIIDAYYRSGDESAAVVCVAST